MIKVTQKISNQEFTIGNTKERHHIKVTPQFVSSLTKNLRFPYI